MARLDDTWIGSGAVRMHQPKRFGPERATVASLLHIVESVRADRAVMHCGKEMKRITQEGELQKTAGGYRACTACFNKWNEQKSTEIDLGL